MKQLSAKEVEQKLAKNESVHIIDVREPSEVATGMISGAINLPLSTLEFRYQELNKTNDYVIVCRSGGRSAQATQFLESHGYRAINMQGGMLAWEGDVH